MKIAITNDHGGVDLKNAIKAAFPEYEWLDLGAEDASHSVDYPDFAYPLGEMIEKGAVARGVAICGAGVGMSIALNRNPSVRCVLCSEPATAHLARAHNDANVIAFGGRLIGPHMAIECLKVFLSTDFEGGRHTARVQKL